MQSLDTLLQQTWRSAATSLGPMCYARSQNAGWRTSIAPSEQSTALIADWNSIFHPGQRVWRPPSAGGTCPTHRRLRRGPFQASVTVLTRIVLS